MNCKPGDLAVIVGEYPGCEENIGAIVHVLADQSDRPDFAEHDEWLVVCERPLMTRDVDTHELYQTPIGDWSLMKDRFLLPIRDPGDDADDEMVQLLGKPSEVTA